MNIRFVRLKKSEMIREAIEDRILPVLSKFEISETDDVFCEVEMENSPQQAGRDLFRVKLSFRAGEMRGFMLDKADVNFYRALSSLSFALPSNLKRYKEKKTKKIINKQRRMKNASSQQRPA